MDEKPLRRRLSCSVVEFVDISNLVRSRSSCTMTSVGEIEPSLLPSHFNSALRHYKSSACSDGTATNLAERRIKGRPSPGRMFYREKSAPTRGEKQLVSGILQNRGFSNADANLYSTAVLEHQNAWRLVPAYQPSSDKNDTTPLLTVRRLQCRTREEEEMDTPACASQQAGMQDTKHDYDEQEKSGGIHIYLPRIEIDES
ncbi:uncharacterized protein LOC106176493 [Lingula anatina]|uniref:Uncharacterized protein LOC106176493 n=1 Tax=Lingula anatina TaxID=7574 RepID=A0A1S3JWD8_LINAN|nr:uncharacterized protein LOC106176493 [Lingula anatina]|eukprot:XP_013414354.1 uncharacterized protein LOC106176493 [Lingula anatina]